MSDPGEKSEEQHDAQGALEDCTAIDACWQGKVQRALGCVALAAIITVVPASSGTHLVVCADTPDGCLRRGHDDGAAHTRRMDARARGHDGKKGSGSHGFASWMSPLSVL